MTVKSAAKPRAKPARKAPALKTVGPAATNRAAAAIDPLRLDLQLCFALYAASNLVTRLYHPLLAPLGLTYPQYVALMALWETSPQTVGDLGVRLSLDSGTLTPLFKRLEGLGLVSRRRHPEDQRRVLIALTAKGRELRAKAAEIPLKVLCQLPIPLADAAALRDALTTLNTRLSAAGRND
jgi:DNA-binding MarR family transcriptional regulator